MFYWVLLVACIKGWNLAAAEPTLTSLSLSSHTLDVSNKVYDSCTSCEASFPTSSVFSTWPTENAETFTSTQVQISVTSSTRVGRFTKSKSALNNESLTATEQSTMPTVTEAPQVPPSSNDWDGCTTDTRSLMEFTASTESGPNIPSITTLSASPVSTTETEANTISPVMTGFQMSPPSSPEVITGSPVFSTILGTAEADTLLTSTTQATTASTLSVESVVTTQGVTSIVVPSPSSIQPESPGKAQTSSSIQGPTSVDIFGFTNTQSSEVLAKSTTQTQNVPAEQSVTSSTSLEVSQSLQSNTTPLLNFPITSSSDTAPITQSPSSPPGSSESSLAKASITSLAQSNISTVTTNAESSSAHPTLTTASVSATSTANSSYKNAVVSYCSVLSTMFVLFTLSL